MIKHYIKIAFRNLWKYKTQSVISIIGLAVGFVCFALSALWIRYEMTYDTFHKDSERMFLVERKSESSYSPYSSYLLFSYLKENFPEIEDACAVQFWDSKIKKDGIDYKHNLLCLDTTSTRFFDIRIVEGTSDFLIPHSNKIAVTEQFAKKLTPNENVLGTKVFSDGKELTVCAVVKNWNAHSNFMFDIIEPIEPNKDWGWVNFFTFLKLRQGVNAETFGQKLTVHKIEKTEQYNSNELKLTPISETRYKTREWNNGVKIEHIFMFAVIGILVIVCVFINYFLLLSNRFRIRSKELAVRKVCGANKMSLFALFFTEFLITLLFVFIFGILFIYLIASPFFELSGISPEFNHLHKESFIYILLIILASSCFFYLLIPILYKQSLQNLLKRANRKKQNWSLIPQLIISIGFVFASVVIVKQVYFLYNADLGFEYKNTASFGLWPRVATIEELDAKLKGIPGVTQTVNSDFSLIPRNYILSYSALQWDGKPENLDRHESIEFLGVNPRYIDFYKLRLIKGNLLTEKDNPEAVLITESALKLFGWTDDPIGKKIMNKERTYKVKGIVQDIHYASPVIPPKPMLIVNEAITENIRLLFRYEEGFGKQIEKEITRLMNEEYPQASVFIFHANDTYDEYIKSENALLKILSFSALVCIAVSLFGFYSIVSLICESRRKEIAIRKINGATIKNILGSFFKEYFTILLISSIIAFIIAYIIVKRWLEHYVLQTTIPFWLYIAIFLLFAIVIILTIGWQIYRVSVENPAETLKMEN